MTDNNDSNNEAIARNRIFILIDGTFVVKWSENRVQELLTGQYRNFERRDFGAHITDFELNQLKQAGIVDDYDKEHVTLSSSIERSRYYQQTEQERTRSYYLHTTLDGSILSRIQDQLFQIDLANEFLARVRDNFVVIFGADGRSFASFDEAEEARCLLIAEATEMFEETVVAFIETTKR